MQKSPISLKRVWLLLALPPILFLMAIIAASVYFGATSGGDAVAIAESVAGATPTLLLIVQSILLLIFWRTLKADHLALPAIGWQEVGGQKLWREILIGSLPGLALALLYIFVLTPFMTAVQEKFGDYVPPGELLTTLGTAVLPFFLANVILAPFVEENIYRGYAITGLRQRYRTAVAVIISCLFFGLLHWAGGFWYMLLTGVVAGGLFAGLFVWRKSIIAPYAAHLALNLVEFLYVWLWVSR